MAGGKMGAVHREQALESQHPAIAGSMAT